MVDGLDYKVEFFTVDSVDGAVLYGECPVCRKWSPRESMRGVSVVLFGEDDVKEKIPLRVCGGCFLFGGNRVRAMRWKNELVSLDLLNKRGAALARDNE